MDRNPLLEIKGLRASVGGEHILKDLDLTVHAGETHAIMGPNGSGKSTLANVVAGRDTYTLTSGTIRIAGEDIDSLSPEGRAGEGLFLAFQYPIEIPGVSNMEFLKTSMESLAKARGEEPLSAVEFLPSTRAIAKKLDLNPEFLKRGVNEGFSGGEKKRNEILQLLSLNPKIALLDETDSGLDIDALEVVSQGVNNFRNEKNAVILITHYQRLLNLIVPDFVHVLANGRIVKSGDKDLAVELESKGYSWIKEINEGI